MPATDTKTRKARSIAITETIADIIARRRKARVGTCEFIFHNEGHAIKDYRKAWHSACVLTGLGRFYCRACRNEQGEYDSLLDNKRKCAKCGAHWEVPRYEGRIMHDFRRSCAHELFKAGSTYEECREVTGHATDSMFKRYADLFSEDERRAIQLKVQERRQSWRTEEFTAMATPATLSN